MSDFSTFFQSQLFIQGVGLLASAFIISGFASKGDIKFKVFLILGNLCFAWHFFLLGAMAAVVVDLINCFRNGFSIYFKKAKIFGFAFAGIYLVAGIITYQNPIDILPTLGAIIVSFAMYNLEGRNLRIAMYFSSTTWLTYGVLVNSLGTIITESFNILANSITIYRLNRDIKNSLTKDTP